MVKRLCPPIVGAKCFDIEEREWVQPFESAETHHRGDGPSYALLAASRLGGSGGRIRVAQTAATQTAKASSGYLKVGALLILAAVYLWSRSEEVMLRRSEEPGRDFDPGPDRNPLNAEARILFAACVMYGLDQESQITFEQFFEFLVRLTDLVKFRFDMDRFCEEGERIVWPTPSVCTDLLRSAKELMEADRRLTETLRCSSLDCAIDKMILGMDRRFERFWREYIRQKLCK